MYWKTYNTKGTTERYLYKFLSLENLKKFLETGNIWFSRADMFGDKMECVLIKDLLEDKPDYKKIEERKKHYFISCWHLADRESLVLWDTYSETKESRRTVGIRFKRSDLVRLIEDYTIRNHSSLFYSTEFTHGRVKYRELIGSDLELLPYQAVKRPAFRKEAAFTYENEYRFVIRVEHIREKAGHNYSTTDTQEVSFKIIINPLLRYDEYAPIKESIERMGFEKKLIPSQLAKWLNPDLW